MVEKAFKSRISKEMVNALKAVSDSTRIRILNILSFGAFHVNEIVNILGMGQSRVSRHLKILTEAGLLQSQREGTWIYYRLVDSIDFYNQFSYDLMKLIVSYKEDLPERESDQKKVAQILKERDERSSNFFNKIVLDTKGEIQTSILHSNTYKGNLLQLIPQKVGSIVDLGCGTGNLIKDFLERSEKVIGIDSSPKMLEKAREIYKEESRLQLIESNLESIPIPNNSQDVVVASMVMHHISNPQIVLSEAYRILKNNGLFCMVDLYKHDQEYMRNNYADLWLGFEPSILTSWLKNSGFSVNEFHEIATGTVFKILILKSTKKGGLNVHTNS